MRKTLIQSLYDFICMPMRLAVLPDSVCEKYGLTSLRQERFYNVMPYIKGRLLDVGCGDNRLVRLYGNGIGVDTYDWGGDAVIIESASNLPFGDGSFDTATFVASLNHIPERKKAIREAHRILRENGYLVITMINPIIGAIGHKIWWYSEDKERGMREGEKYGLWSSNIIELCEDAGFKVELHKRFVYCMNNLYIFAKRS